MKLLTKVLLGLWVSVTGLPLFGVLLLSACTDRVEFHKIPVTNYVGETGYWLPEDIERVRQDEVTSFGILDISRRAEYAPQKACVEFWGEWSGRRPRRLPESGLGIEIDQRGWEEVLTGYRIKRVIQYHGSWASEEDRERCWLLQRTRR